MKDAAGRTEFERAAAIRDQLRALEVTLESQRVVSRDFVDQDVIGFYREGMAIEMVVMVIRQGKLVGNKGFSFGGQEFPDSELLSSFVGLLYDSPAAAIPDEVLLPFAIEDAELKAEWLSERRAERRRKVEVLVPQRADRKRLVELAEKNARASFASRRNAREDSEVMLAKLQKRLRLSKLPRVIECYDISHIQGYAPVASMVVFVDGRPERSRYRTYRVRGAETAAPGRRGNDDFASMYEVLSRRLRRARQGDAGWELPDLIVIDGGKGQLGMALAAARDCEIDTRPGQGLAIIGLAKERDVEPPVAGETTATTATTTTAEAEGAAAVVVSEEVPAEVPADIASPPEARRPAGRGRPRSAGGAGANGDARRPDRIFLPHAKDAIPIRPSSAEMFVLQQLRDEAHRFAIGFHRRRRGQLTLRSALADVPGIGEARQRALLRFFGSVRKIREATIEELESVPGMTHKAAAAVLAHLGTAPSTPAPTSPSGARDPEPAETPESPESPEDEASDEALENAFAAIEADPDFAEGSPVAEGAGSSAEVIPEI
jgi:excinuclease ABC subunit C